MNATFWMGCCKQYRVGDKMVVNSGIYLFFRLLPLETFISIDFYILDEWRTQIAFTILPKP